ncbi:MAG: orotidine-5'-phosphate decarboxylase [Dethiobacter sp.]|nr:orotidine-5'-phosphate decarboxylase [Dethiobacter sp.]
MKPFSERLHERIQQTGSSVCLGLDPRPEAHPLTHPERFGNDPAQIAKAVVNYFRAIIEATADAVACYKPQTAFFEALGIPGLIALAQLLADIRAIKIPVILDAKRGDISTTAAAYAQAYLGDGVFAADALTVNPYLGVDSLQPFLTQAISAGRGLFVLVKTSNPGSRDFQDTQLASGQTLYEHVADALTALAEAHRDRSGYSPVGAVVGATYPRELAALRRRLPHSLLLVPGYGAQGGSAEDVAPAFDERGLGAVVNASRGLTYTTTGDDFAERARQLTLAMRDALNRAIER